LSLFIHSDFTEALVLMHALENFEDLSMQGNGQGLGANGQGQGLIKMSSRWRTCPRGLHH